MSRTPDHGRQRWRATADTVVALVLFVGVLLAAGLLVGAVRRRAEPAVEAALSGRAWWEHLALGVTAGLALAAPGLLHRVGTARLASLTSALAGCWTCSVALLLWVVAAPPRRGDGAAQHAYRQAVGAFWWSSLLVFMFAAALATRRRRPTMTSLGVAGHRA